MTAAVIAVCFVVALAIIIVVATLKKQRELDAPRLDRALFPRLRRRKML